VNQIDIRGKKLKQEFDFVKNIRKPKNNTESGDKKKNITLDDIKAQFGTENLEELIKKMKDEEIKAEDFDTKD